VCEYVNSAWGISAVDAFPLKEKGVKTAFLRLESHPALAGVVGIGVTSPMPLVIVVSSSARSAYEAEASSEPSDSFPEP
jgi:hypothetical protein